MLVKKCDICEDIYNIKDIDVRYELTVEGQDYPDLCDRCRKWLYKSVTERREQVNIKAVCPECNR